LILISALTIGHDGFASDHIAAFLVSIATTVLFWWLYISRVGYLLTKAVEAHPVRLRPALSAAYVHLVIVAGIVATAVGAARVIAHPLERAQPGWIAVILGGPALFLAGLVGFAYALFRHVSRSQPIGLLVLAALGPVTLLAPLIIVALAATTVLAGIMVADKARTWRRPSRQPPAPG
jgi:low temperature requirement protein LtrA